MFNASIGGQATFQHEHYSVLVMVEGRVGDGVVRRHIEDADRRIFNEALQDQLHEESKKRRR